MACVVNQEPDGRERGLSERESDGFPGGGDTITTKNCNWPWDGAVRRAGSGDNAGNGRASHRVSTAALSSTLQERPARHCQHLCGVLSCGHQQCRTHLAAEGGDEIVLDPPSHHRRARPPTAGARVQLDQPFLQLDCVRAELAVRVTTTGRMSGAVRRHLSACRSTMAAREHSGPAFPDMPPSGPLTKIWPRS